MQFHHRTCLQVTRHVLVLFSICVRSHHTCFSYETYPSVGYYSLILLITPFAHIICGNTIPCLDSSWNFVYKLPGLLHLSYHACPRFVFHCLVLFGLIFPHFICSHLGTSGDHLISSHHCIPFFLQISHFNICSLS